MVEELFAGIICFIVGFFVGAFLCFTFLIGDGVPIQKDHKVRVDETTYRVIDVDNISDCQIVLTVYTLEDKNEE